MEEIKKSQVNSWDNLKIYSIHTIFDKLYSDEVVACNLLKNKSIKLYYYRKLRESFKR